MSRPVGGNMPLEVRSRQIRADGIRKVVRQDVQSGSSTVRRKSVVQASKTRDGETEQG